MDVVNLCGTVKECETKIEIPCDFKRYFTAMTTECKIFNQCVIELFIEHL